MAFVSYLRHFGTQGYFLNFPSRFITHDGTVAWLCYSANYANRYDGGDFSRTRPVADMRCACTRSGLLS